jgi:hypothetical protein
MAAQTPNRTNPNQRRSGTAQHGIVFSSLLHRSVVDHAGFSKHGGNKNAGEARRMGLQPRPEGHAGVIKGGQDFLCGLLFALIGAAGLWIGRDYPMGTPQRLGTGVFPRILCWGLVGIGAIVLVRGLVTYGPAIGGWAWRPVLLIGAAAVSFALLIESAGLFAAMIVMMVLGALAGQGHRPKEFAVFAVIMLALAWVIFIWGLNMPIKVFPWS